MVLVLRSSSESWCQGVSKKLSKDSGASSSVRSNQDIALKSPVIQLASAILAASLICSVNVGIVVSPLFL